MRHRLYSILIGCLLAAGIGAGAVTASEGKLELKDVKLGGYAFWQFGQIVKGYDRLFYDINHQWINGALIGISIEAQPSERLRLVVSPEFKLSYPYPELLGKARSVRPLGVSYINEADGIFSFGDVENPFLQLALGMFSYKYNPDVKNLGEYLFRTGTYPTYIISDFDFSKARLLGLLASFNSVSNLKADFLLTSEAFIYPLYDFSLSGIASYKLLNSMEVGAGVDFARLLPVVNSKTSPDAPMTDPANYMNNAYFKENGDTGYYSFKATKLMMRASIDPKVFFGSPDIFGPEDLKLYGEVTAVGLGGYHAADTVYRGTDTLISPYPAYYNDLNQRTPRMIGFNLPAFKVFDVLSAEVEYFPNPIPNDYYLVITMMSPMPYITVPGGKYNPDDYKDGFWRWSFFGKKEIVGGFSVTGQIAFDHLRTAYWEDGSTNEYESLTKKGHWYWVVKTGYSF